jgi:Domain of unknown function (DUF4124)
MRRCFMTVLLLALPLTAAWAADVYRSVDAQGHVQYSDTPTPGAVLVSTADVASDSTADDGETANRRAIEKAADEASDQTAAEDAQRAVEKDTAAAHAAQCKQAQDVYQKSITARRLYTLDSSGNRQYMSDQQADQQRVQYRMAMEAACGESDSQ